ncbi:MAG: peptidase C13 [Proteobacteria bacterium]|nr:peptidase C13 [Pseudomonadota bacterium]
MRGGWRHWRNALAAVLIMAAPATAQQQAQDPFNGQFGAMQLAPSAPEAARLSRMMGDALSALQPERPGHQDVYLIVAALWGEPVFEREATQAEEILRTHLHAEGRSILLTAGGEGARAHPDSTPENIAAAIGQVGSMINPNEDLVVVFITSHGSSDGAAALRSRQTIGALRPPNLRDLLNQAGIVNRVVIVSACFSGAFIAPLADDNTIVLTAAAPDRTSFGCQPEREWTFFGDAYFNHAVRGGAGLLPGFEQAKTLITQWEHDQNLTPPSNPQKWIGAHAAEMLHRAEAAH